MKEIISKFVCQSTQGQNALSVFALLEQPNSDFPFPTEVKQKKLYA